MKSLPLFFLSLTLLLTGCNGSHLDIFPELDDPTLMERELSVEQLHQDIDAFVEGAITRHPDLGEYADLASVKQAAKDLKSEITAAMTRTEFYQVIGKLNHTLNDGHSLLIWPYQEYQRLQEKGHKLFPFEVVITGQGDIYLKHGYHSEDQSVNAGAQVRSLNGIEAEQLLRRLQQYANGETPILREQVVAQRFGLILWAGMGWLDNFELAIEQGEQSQTVIITPEQNWQINAPTKQTKAHYYRKVKPGVGLLYLEHFDVDPGDFEDFIDESFEKVKQDGIHSLIIDIRDNPGGNTDTVTYLSRYIADKPFRLVSSVREKLNQENRGWFNYKGEVGDIIVQEWDDWEKPVSSENRFTGDVYLLIGQISYSSAIVLATTLKDNEFATLVGETTGGFANQTAQGNLFNLPHSQLRAYVATRTLVRPSGDVTRKGVEPHVVAFNSLDDIKSNRDAGIERILEMIESK